MYNPTFIPQHPTNLPNPFLCQNKCYYFFKIFIPTLALGLHMSIYRACGKTEYENESHIYTKAPPNLTKITLHPLLSQSPPALIHRAGKLSGRALIVNCDR
jgi:hypothetical protein